MKTLAKLKLKRKLFVAMALTTIIPFLLLVCFFSGVAISKIAGVLLLAIISFGWLIVLNVFFGIIKISEKYSEVLEKEKKLPAVDEVQTLEGIMEVMSEKVKTGLQYLQEYSDRTKELNSEISQKVLTLSTILKANELFSINNDSEKVVKVLVEGLAQILNVKGCFLCLEKEEKKELIVVKQIGTGSCDIKKLVDDDRLFFSRLLRTSVFEQTEKATTEWRKELNSENIVFAPIVSGDKKIGVLCVFDGNSDRGFMLDEIETINLFAQNIAVIWDHKILEVKIDELEITDSLTGLYNAKYMFQKLQEETTRAQACQRPCGFVLIQIEGYKEYQKNHGDLESEKILKKIARAFKKMLEIMDVPGRMDTDKLSAILIERNKRETSKMKESIRHNLNALIKGVKVRVSMAEMPIDGLTAREILTIAETRLDENE